MKGSRIKVEIAHLERTREMFVRKERKVTPNSLSAAQEYSLQLEQVIIKNRCGEREQ